MQKNTLYRALAPLLMLLLIGFSACDQVAEADRLVYHKPEKQEDDTTQRIYARAVLIEDLTGQNCSNCPNAAELIEDYMKTYGEDRIIPMAIHCGALGFAGTPALTGLMTKESKDYGEQWGTGFGQPSGKINRSETLESAQWTYLVTEQVKRQTAVKIEPSAVYDAATRSVTLSLKMLTGDAVSGMLQLALTEDSIVAVQRMQDTKMNKEYVHNHVFRTALNTITGEPISLAAQSDVTKTFTYTIADKYKAENCAIVAFIYNGADVLQVAKVKVAE